MPYKKKKKGFTMFEVLLALMIFSFAILQICVLLNNMLKKASYTKSIGIKIEETPLVYSAVSPLLKKNNNMKEMKDVFGYEQVSVDLAEFMVDKKDKKRNLIENVFIGIKKYNKFDVGTIYSNFFLVLPEKLNKENNTK